MRFTATVTEENDLFVAQCLEVDVASQGKTVEEALSNLREALELYFEGFWGIDNLNRTEYTRIMSEYLTLAEVSKRLRLSLRYVYTLVHTGQIPAAKVGTVWRVSEEDLASFYESHKQHKKPEEGTESS